MLATLPEDETLGDNLPLKQALRALHMLHKFHLTNAEIFAYELT